MKTCFKCGINKPFTEFYKHKQMADGYLNKCKDCSKKDSIEHRHGKGREKALAYDLERANNPERKNKMLERSRVYSRTHSKRRYAQTVLARAVKKGSVLKCLCFVCGEKAEAHHADYDKPLDVMWLCSSHHKQAHALTK